MRNALDGSKSGRDGHNSALPQRRDGPCPSFVFGQHHTAFIARSFPRRFSTAFPPSDDVPAAHCERQAGDAPRRRGSPRARCCRNGRSHERKVGSDWIVNVCREPLSGDVKADHGGSTRLFRTTGPRLRRDQRLTGRSTWPCCRWVRVTVLKVGRFRAGSRTSRGADPEGACSARLRQAELAATMIEKTPADTFQAAAGPECRLIVKDQCRKSGTRSRTASHMHGRGHEEEKHPCGRAQKVIGGQRSTRPWRQACPVMASSMEFE